MNLPVKIRRDWHYYAFAIGLIFILNGVVGLLGFEAKGWQTYAVGLVVTRSPLTRFKNMSDGINDLVTELSGNKPLVIPAS